MSYSFRGLKIFRPLESSLLCLNDKRMIHGLWHDSRNTEEIKSTVAILRQWYRMFIFFLQLGAIIEWTSVVWTYSVSVRDLGFGVLRCRDKKEDRSVGLTDTLKWTGQGGECREVGDDEEFLRRLTLRHRPVWGERFTPRVTEVRRNQKKTHWLSKMDRIWGGMEKWPSTNNSLSMTRDNFQ